MSPFLGTIAELGVGWGVGVVGGEVGVGEDYWLRHVCLSLCPHEKIWL